MCAHASGEYDLTKPREENDWRNIYYHGLDTCEALQVMTTSIPVVSDSQSWRRDWEKRISKTKLNSIPTLGKFAFKNSRIPAKSQPINTVPIACHLSRLTRSVETNEHIFADGYNLFGISLEDYEPNVEYDMDEQENLNLERMNRGQISMTPEDFEFLIDRFERAWYFLSRAAYKWTSRRVESEYAEELHCDICGDGETTSHNNIIVLCERCDIAVHQDCYGVPLIPEGPWLCRRCYLNAGNVSCCLCPWKSGAFKQTTDLSNPWCHLLCSSMLGGETHVLNAAYQEPVDIGRIHPERWGLVCQICRIKSGAPIQCSVKSCHIALHPKCARYARCTINTSSKSLFCWKHSSIKDTDGLSPIADHGTICNVTADILNKPSGDGHVDKAFQKPVICQMISDAILKTSFCSSLKEENRRGLVEVVARFWCLKRGMRHGASLIKSLQIEPWTSGGILSSVHECLEQRRKLLQELKQLEHVCLLTSQREKLKLSSLLLSKDIVQIFLNPFTTILSTLVYELRIYENAIVYNKEGTIYYLAAVEFIREARTLFIIARKRLKKLGISGPLDTLNMSTEVLAGLTDESPMGGLQTKTESRKPNPKSKPLKRTKTIDSSSSASLPDTDLVWGKIKGHPYYPATVIAFESLSKREKRQIPKPIITAYRSRGRTIVRFFDKEKAWAALAMSSLIPLGFDLEKDMEKISSMKRLKPSTLKDIRRAHKEALLHHKNS